LTTTTAKPQNLSRRGRILYGGVALLLVLIFSELLSLVVFVPLLNLRLSDKIRSKSEIFEEQSKLIRELLEPGQLLEIHPVMGWRYAPEFDRPPHRLNSAALRSNHEYDLVPSEGVHRVAAFGDSFVYGSEVENHDAWPEIIEQENPDIEVLNYGVPGYGVDQAYLRYRTEGRAYDPQLILIGFSPTDLSRIVNVYRRFYHSQEVPLFKPRFALDNQNELAFIECPVCSPAAYEQLLEQPSVVIAFGRNDHWYEPAIYENPAYDYSALVKIFSLAAVKLRRYFDRDRLNRGNLFNEESLAARIQSKIFVQFVQLVRERGARPLVVLLPDQPTVEAVQRGEQPVYEPLVRDLRGRGIDLIDVADYFRSGNQLFESGRWFAREGHYSLAGNRVVASGVASAIRQRLR
jgi:hypothetical protein